MRSLFKNIARFRFLVGNIDRTQKERMRTRQGKRPLSGFLKKKPTQAQNQCSLTQTFLISLSPIQPKDYRLWHQLTLNRNNTYLANNQDITNGETAVSLFNLFF